MEHLEIQNQWLETYLYVSRIDKVFLHKTGSFQIAQGTPSLSPTDKRIDAIELFEVFLPAFTQS